MELSTHTFHSYLITPPFFLNPGHGDDHRRPGTGVLPPALIIIHAIPQYSLATLHPQNHIKKHFFQEGKWAL